MAAWFYAQFNGITSPHVYAAFSHFYVPTEHRTSITLVSLCETHGGKLHRAMTTGEQGLLSSRT